MKFKYYMRGFGAGLIIATIVLMVAGKIQNNNKALVTDNNENQRTGSVIAFTTESSTEGTENAESETETESQKQENESTIQATTVSETKQRQWLHRKHQHSVRQLRLRQEMEAERLNLYFREYIQQHRLQTYYLMQEL